MDAQMKKKKNRSNIRISTQEEGEQITEEEEAQEEVAKEETMATIIVIIEGTIDGDAIEKTARRNIPGNQKDPKIFLQPAEGANQKEE